MENLELVNSTSLVKKPSITYCNLTPHVVNILNKRNGQIMAIPPSGVVARVSTCFEMDYEFDGIEIGHTKYGEVTGLLEPVEGTLYIVSLVLLKAAPDRKDLVVPNDLVRDEKGMVLYARSFTR